MEKQYKTCFGSFIDVEQPWIDGKVPPALCPGVLGKYKLLPGSGVAWDLLRCTVVPGRSTFYSDNNRFLNVLSLALLWASLDDECSAWLRKRVRSAYDAIKALPVANSVEKVLLVVYNVQGQIAIQEIEDGFGIGMRTGTMNNVYNNDQLNLLFLQQQQTHARFGELSDTLTTSVLQGLSDL